METFVPSHDANRPGLRPDLEAGQGENRRDWIEFICLPPKCAVILVGRGLRRVSQQGHPKSLGVLKTDAGLLPPTVHSPAKPKNRTGHTQCQSLRSFPNHTPWILIIH